MMAIIGMFFQDGLTGSAWGDWALYTASPLRAFESELGVQAPVGRWLRCKPGSSSHLCSVFLALLCSYVQVSV